MIEVIACFDQNLLVKTLIYHFNLVLVTEYTN